jgi:hypothetical protein
MTLGFAAATTPPTKPATARDPQEAKRRARRIMD